MGIKPYLNQTSPRRGLVPNISDSFQNGSGWVQSMEGDLGQVKVFHKPHQTPPIGINRLKVPIGTMFHSHSQTLQYASACATHGVQSTDHQELHKNLKNGGIDIPKININQD